MPAAVITGASSGIGLELAKLFAAARYDLVLVARREKTLHEVAGELSRRHGVAAWPVPADLASADGCGAVVREVEARGVEVGALVNNAGFGFRGLLVDTPLDRALEMIDVNVRALTHLTRLLLPGMLARRAGRILNVASTAAFQPGPLMSVYYATKAYVLSFSVALSVELDRTGVTSTALCPGPTRTEFQKIAGVEGTALAGRGLAMDAETVALMGYRGMMSGKTIVTPGALNRLLALGTRAVPRSWAARLAKLSQEVRGKKTA
jgi:hypothetical protein